MERLPIIPREVYAEDIRFIRKRLRLTQKGFAELTNVSYKTVQGWERSEKGIVGPIVPLIQALLSSARVYETLTIPEKRMPVRLWYMYRNEVCTIIDVDEMQRHLKLYNMVEDISFRAFGRNTEPTFEEYESFLESRCFPRTRDKMKLILNDLNIPFYDPMLIIEKTKGKMAEDDFWIRIER